MTNESEGRFVGFLIVAGGLLLRTAENRLGIPSGTLARYRAQVGPRPSETAAWRQATDVLLTDARVRGKAGLNGETP